MSNAPPVDTDRTAGTDQAVSGPPSFWRQWLTHPDLRYGALLAAVTYVTLRFTSPAVGFTRDEGYYFKAGEQYFGWYRALWRNLWEGNFWATFSDATITKYFEYNHEHPVLIKTLMGFTWWFTHELLGVSDNAEGFRVVGPLFAALCTCLTYALGRRAGLGQPFALFAGLAWWLMPHNYFYSHLACFDVPVTAMTVLVVYAYLRGLRSGRAAVVAGLVFGLACATKHNALFLAVILVGHYFVMHWRELRLRAGPGGGLQLPPIPLAFLFMAIAAPLVMYLHWPYLWHHPIERFGSYLAFHLNHEHYPISYGDQLLLTPPFPISFPFVMTAYTIPLTTLLLVLAGIGLACRSVWCAIRRRPDPGTVLATVVAGETPVSTVLMWGVMAAFPICLIALPSVPIFGGVKHWMPATPFLALFAATALAHGTRALRPVLAARWRTALAPGMVILALLPSLVGVVSTHPYGMSYYNELAGGVRGGAQKNLQRTFWGHSDRRLIEDPLNRAPDGSRVFFNRTNFDCVRMYKRDGELKNAIQNASSVERSDFALVFHQGGYYEEMYKVWQEYGDRRHLDGVFLFGVPLVTLHARAGKVLAQ